MSILLNVDGLSKSYGRQVGLPMSGSSSMPVKSWELSASSGSGKTTLLRCLAGHLEPDSGTVSYSMRDGGFRDTLTMDEAERRHLMRTDWAFVHQNPRDGLRMSISAGGNIGERLMAVGDRHYGNIRQTATNWLERVEIDASRIDDRPSTFSGGMQQRLQIARNLVTSPRLVFMDEPTGGLDVSVQARALDLLRNLVAELDLAVIIVTHDLAVVRMLADRMMVMRRGRSSNPASRIRCSTIRLMNIRSFWSARSCRCDMLLSVSKLEKSFHLYQQNNAHISVLSGASFDVEAGECVALTGPSGCGKSSLMRMIYGNYRAEAGSIMIGDTDLVTATPREVMAIRRSVVGYVSQFLRVLPRIPTIKVVAEPFVRAGGGETEAEQHGRRTAGPPSHSRGPLVALTADLQRRRTATGQHCARLRLSLPASSARRADRQPRPPQPPDRCRTDRRDKASRRGDGRHLP